MNVGFAGLLAIVFIVLKLIGTITWGWVWVLSPLWITAILMILISWAISMFPTSLISLTRK